MDTEARTLMAKIVARAWTDDAFRVRLLADARTACGELGMAFADDCTVVVLENTPEMHHLVMPVRPVGTHDFSEAELAALVTSDAMMGFEAMAERATWKE